MGRDYRKHLKKPLKVIASTEMISMGKSRKECIISSGLRDEHSEDIFFLTERYNTKWW